MFDWVKKNYNLHKTQFQFEKTFTFAQKINENYLWVLEIPTLS